MRMTLRRHCRPTKPPFSFAWYVCFLIHVTLTHMVQDRELDKVNAFYTVKEAEV